MTEVVTWTDEAVASAPAGFVAREMAAIALRPFVDAGVSPSIIKMFRRQATHESIVLVSDEPVEVLRKWGWPL